jgi:hypothetical protein
MIFAIVIICLLIRTSETSSELQLHVPSDEIASLQLGKSAPNSKGLPGLRNDHEMGHLPGISGDELRPQESLKTQLEYLAVLISLILGTDVLLATISPKQKRRDHFL